MRVCGFMLVCAGCSGWEMGGLPLPGYLGEVLEDTIEYSFQGHLVDCVSYILEWLVESGRHTSSMVLPPIKAAQEAGNRCQ